MDLKLDKPDNVSPRFKEFTIEDQVLLSNSFWVAFESDFEADEASACAEYSVQFELAWHILPEHLLPILLNRYLRVAAWRAGDGVDYTEQLDAFLSNIKKRSHISVSGETVARFRQRLCMMVACKQYSEAVKLYDGMSGREGALCEGELLARLDFKLKQSLRSSLSHGLGIVRDELDNGVTTLMASRSQGAQFLALQLLLRWHSLTQTTVAEGNIAKERFARLLGSRFESPLAIIGAMEMSVHFATTYKEREQYECTIAFLSQLPDELFCDAYVPSKAVYKAVFATRWAVAIGNCREWAATGVPELVKDCCLTIENFTTRSLRAYPFAELRFGLAVHFYHLGLDLMTAVSSSGLTKDCVEIYRLSLWLTSHVSVRNLHGPSLASPALASCRQTDTPALSYAGCV